MSENKFAIKADVFGKIKYWDSIHGLHSGRGKLGGYNIYATEGAANTTIARLKSVFHSGIKFTVIPHSQIPFIKKQIKTQPRPKGNKHHIFVHGGNPGSLCGIRDSDNPIYNSGKFVTCKKCLKLKMKKKI